MATHQFFPRAAPYVAICTYLFMVVIYGLNRMNYTFDTAISQPEWVRVVCGINIRGHSVAIAKATLNDA